MKPIQIIIAVPIFPNTLQTYILNQLVAFKSMGTNFSVLAEVKRTYKPLPSIIKNHQLLDDVIYINPCLNNIVKELVSLPIFKPAYWSAIIKILNYRGIDYGMACRIKSLLRIRALIIQPFDIIHSHSLYLSHHYLFIKDIFSKPIVTTYHGKVPCGVKSLPDHKQKQVFERVDKLIVNTEYAKDELVQLGCPAEKISIIPQGTNLDNFPFTHRKIKTDEKTILLSIGRLSPEKGHAIAIEALSKLIKDYPELEYHIIGDGPEKQKLIALATQKNIQANIIFHGFKTGDELLHLISTAHIFILPSLAETQGVVLQEAQSSGLPVIASRTGGVPYVINDNETGLLFNTGDYHDLALKIKMLLNNPALYSQLCLSAREDVQKRFDINLISKKLFSLYHQVLDKSPDS